MVYLKQLDDQTTTYPEVLLEWSIISKNVYNPFRIIGFHQEQPIIYFLFDSYINDDTFLPYAYTEKHSLVRGNHIIKTCTYEGSFNGYPLKRIFADGETETFTYEEFYL